MAINMALLILAAQESAPGLLGILGGGVLLGALAGAITSVFTTQVQIRAERRRLIEERKQKFGAFRRGVYRDFLDLAFDPPGTDPVGKQGLDREAKYQHCFNTLLLTADDNVLEAVRAIDSSRTALQGNRSARDELVKVMRREIFPEDHAAVPSQNAADLFRRIVEFGGRNLRS